MSQLNNETELRSEINRIHQRPAIRAYIDIVDDLVELFKKYASDHDREVRLDEIKNLIVAQGSYPPDSGYSKYNHFYVVEKPEVDDRIAELEDKK